MDSSLGTQEIDINKLSAADQRDIRQTYSNEMQKMKVQEAVHSLTDTCWKKCITGPIKSNTLDRSEEGCAQNCVNRFMDAGDTLLEHLQKVTRAG